ncbi:Hpt domain-containing protein [Arcobacteraceae bacterium]|nr:Hpt domain-containing protein [Arcobacteraceae bacterium]
MDKINLQKIADELEFDLEDVEMLIEVFLESALESLLALDAAIKERNFVIIFESAHAIKGSSANLTLIEISDTAKTIETAARESKEIDYESLYNKLFTLINGIR